ncbi:spinster family MFS transporter [Sphingomonas sp. MMS12-HWE2-04]|uniref:spinster family MFS transporter n=1 Tax=Sphingomonas sp. MMS12-HWE2-04 TaxID=3234199 RepID=UPI00384AF685
MHQPNADRPAPAEADYRYGWYVTAVLMVAYTFSFLDRQILNLMVSPIEHDLGINDLQFALLTGAAFGILYTIAGLPLGWLADRYPRKWIVSGGIACWSVMTAVCGLAGSFGQLFVARIGVGVGEAALSPSAYSMLSDLFDRSRLPRALSLYTFGIFLGVGLAMILGGEIIDLVERLPLAQRVMAQGVRSWQLVFLVVGLPGLLVAGWLATLREPARRGDRTDPASAGLDLRPLFTFLLQHKRMSFSLLIGSALLSVLSSIDAWYPELFIRTFGWSSALSGRANGLSSLIGGPIGLVFAGTWSSRMLKAGRTDACLRLTALAALGTGLAAIVMPLMANPWAMTALLFPIKFFMGFTPVLIPAAIQMVAPNRLRGQMSAAFLFTTGLVGVTCGPVLPALLTDYVFGSPHMLRYALAISAAIITPLAFGGLWLGMAQYRTAYAAQVG